jgi:salicylate hydroxylase/6-hydroxynicotinate 3-monooxygenase
MICYATPKRDRVSFTTNQPEQHHRKARESWSATADPAELREAFAMFHSDVQRVIAAAPEVHACGICDRDPASAWSKGQVVLLGDACHPMLHSGPAAAMALEDAVVLARCIEEADSIERAFVVYEANRKPRTSAVQAGLQSRTRKDANPDWLYGYDVSRIPLRTKAAAEASTYYEA